MYTQYAISLLKPQKLDIPGRVCGTAWDHNINHPGWNIKRKSRTDSTKTNIVWHIFKENNVDDVKKPREDSAAYYIRMRLLQCGGEI
jgi:hypothetical protein